MAEDGIQDLVTGAQARFDFAGKMGVGQGRPGQRLDGAIPGLPASVPPVRLPVPDLPAPGWPQPQREYTRPHYSERFRCISSACEDTCCQGWGVPIDQGTFEKYRSHELLKPHIGTLIQLNANGPTTSDYARMPLTVNGTCGFLDPQKLCEIHKTLGPGMLSVTCSTYPRAVSTHAEVVEKALNLSCPEAARLTLLMPDLLGDGLGQARGAGRYRPVIEAGNRILRREEARLAVREFALIMLRDRRYPVWQRLYLLGNLTRRLQSMAEQAGCGTAAAWCEANPAAVSHLLADSAATAASGRLQPVMERMEAKPGEQLVLVIDLVRQRVTEPPIPGRFLECVQEFEAGLGCSSGKGEAAILGAYAESYERYYKPFTERHPHLIENYMLNHVFKNNYPFGRATTVKTANEPNAEDEHLALCAHVAMVQTLLIGVAGRHQEAFATAHAVKLVSSLAKTVEHSRKFQEQIAGFLAERKLNNAQGIALLTMPPAPSRESWRDSAGHTGGGRLGSAMEA